MSERSKPGPENPRVRRRVGVIGLLAVMLGAAACATSTGSTTTNTDTRQLSEGLAGVSAGATVDPGVEYLYAFGIHCGMRYIEDINGVNWATDRPLYIGSGSWPESFRQFFVNPEEAISPVLRTHITLIGADELVLTLPDGSKASTYTPTTDEVPPCA